MSSNPSDVLGTVFLWVCFCILSSIAYLSLTGDGKPTAPQITLSHHSIEPQAVLPPPLWSFDLPPPREPPQPTFEPRPEPEPLPRRRNGLIPRAERRVRPAVFPERHVQREQHMTELSNGKRAAAADKQAAKEARQAQKEQDLHWRSKASAHKEAKAEREQDAASRTGGERKQLDIDLDAAKNRPSNSQNIKIERPPYEGSNAFTGTALGDKTGTAYAPPMDIEENGNAAKPLAGEVQESDHTPDDNTSMAPAENPTANQRLAGEVQETDHTLADNTPMVPGEKPAANQRLAGEVQEVRDIVADHSSTTEEAQSINPFLTLNDEDAASGLNAELGMLQQLKADFQTDETWNRRVLWVYTSWREWITCGHTIKWHFDKLNEAQTQYFKPMVDEVFALFDKRCGKRNDGVPADALNETLAVISEVRDNMNEALGLPKSGDSGQPDILEQPIRPPSVENGQTTSDVQLSKDEQSDHVQEQISEDHESAERLHQELNQHGEQSNHIQEQIAQDHESAERLSQELNQQSAQISSDRELAKKVAQEQELEKKQQHQQAQQRQQRKTAPVHKQKYIHGDLVDLQTRTRKQDYPQTAVASGSGTYPKDKKARQDVNVPESPLPWPKLPTYKVVKLASEQVVVPSFHAPAGGVQESDYTAASDVTMVLDEEQVNTDTINIPANQLLGLPYDAAWETLASWLSEADSTHKTLTPDEIEPWYQMLILLFTYWWQWLATEDISIWRYIEPCKVIELANVACNARDLINGRFGDVTNEAKMVCERMGQARQLAEMEEQARVDEGARQQSIHMAQMVEQQQLAQKLEAEKQEEQARISEEQRQEAMRTAQSQQQQQPQNPPIEDDDEDLYGNDARGEASQQAFIAARKMGLANAESVAVDEAEPKATDDENDLEAEIHAILDQPDSAVQQQPSSGAVEPRQQASASSATTQQHSSALTGLSQSLWNTTQTPLLGSVPDDHNKAQMGEQGQNAQPNAAVQQQQHVGDPSQPHQQAPPAPLANLDAMPAARQNTHAEPRTNPAKIVAPETKQPAQDEMDTSGTEIAPGTSHLSIQKTDLQKTQFSFAVGGFQKKHQEAFKKNLQAENVARKTAADRATFKGGWKLESGNHEALFVSDDIQKRHQDDLGKEQAKAKAEVDAANKSDNKAPEARSRSGSDSSLTSFESD